MGINVGAIFVQAGRGVDATRVAGDVARYWKSRGAKPDTSSPLDLRPLGVGEKKSKRLGVAIAPAAKGWIGVRDSERYFADYGLAKHLSKVARVCWVVISDATDSAILQVLEKGKVRESIEGSAVDAVLKRLKIPDVNLYFEDLHKKKLPGWRLLGFSPVVAAKYDTGPEPADEGDEDDDEADDGQPPDPKFAAWHERLDKGFMLGDRDWERVLGLDEKYQKDVCRLCRRALEGKEARASVLSCIAGTATEAGDLALFKAVLDRAPDAKMHPIDKPSLMWRLGAYMVFQLFKKQPLPAEWKPSVQKWIKAALPYAKRESDITETVAKVKTLLK